MRYLLLLLFLGAIASIPIYFLTAERGLDRRPKRIVAEDALQQDKEIERQLRSLRTNGR